MKNGLLVFIILILLSTNLNLVAAAPGDFTRISAPAFDENPNGDSYSPRITPDGRFIVFDSEASNLVWSDTNGAQDVFVYDRQSGSTTRVSVSSSGVDGNSSSFGGAISADGRYVAFASVATNLVPGDSNNQPDIFVRDLQTNTTTRVSVATGGTQANNYSHAPAISADGRYVAFHSAATNLVAGDSNNALDVFLHDRNSGTTTRVSVGSGGVQANGNSIFPSISADGKFVAFSSSASNLVGGDTNGKNDVFRNEISKNTITRVSVPVGDESNGDSYGASISADGSRVVFYSYASNLVMDDTNKSTDIFMYDFQNHEVIRVSVGSGGNEANNHSDGPAISPDGFFIAFHSDATNLSHNDGNNASDIFVHTWENTETTLISRSQTGNSANDGSFYPSISQFGEFIAFDSSASDLVPNDTNGFSDIFVVNGVTSEVFRISVANPDIMVNDYTFSPAISENGRFVAYMSYASNLVRRDSNGFADIFVLDRQTKKTTRVSVKSDGTQANGDSFAPVISADGRYVAFVSNAGNLVNGDDNGTSDIFLHDRQTMQTTLVSVSSFGLIGNSGSNFPSISGDGRYVAFESTATNLVSGDTNFSSDIFVRDVISGTTVRVSLDSSGNQVNSHSYDPAISSNGRFVVFESEATNLIGSDTNEKTDIFVRDLVAGSTMLVSKSSDGVQSNQHSYDPTISGDGRYIAFSSESNNLDTTDTDNWSDVFIFDRLDHTTRLVPFLFMPGGFDFGAFYPVFSADGRYLVFDTQSLVPDPLDPTVEAIFVIHDRATNQSWMVQCAPQGDYCLPSLSANGQFVTYQSNYFYIYLYENNVTSSVFLPLVVR